MSEDMTITEMAQRAMQSKQEGDLRYEWLVERLAERMHMKPERVDHILFLLAMGIMPL